MAKPYAGMAAYKAGSTLARLSEAYATISDPETKRPAAPGLAEAFATARADKSLTAPEREEVELLDAKIEMRAEEAQGNSTLEAAESKLKAFIQTAQMPEFRSEAQGWLAHIYYLQGNQAAAGKIYLDELNRGGSNLSRQVLLNSLKMTYGYDGGPNLLSHLDEYFDTPEHAAFAIQLITNPLRDDDFLRTSKAAEAQKNYGRISSLLDKHITLLKTGEGANALAALGMRVALRMGDPPGALKVAAVVPAGAPVRQDPDFNWMLASASFLTHDYAAAERPLLRAFRSRLVSPTQKAAAAYGLCGVYEKTQNRIEQIRFALWLHTNAKDDPPDDDIILEPSVYLALSGFDLGLLLDDEASVEDIENFLKRYPDIHGARTAKYSLAVRYARENRYRESAEIYESIHQTRRAPRMRQLEGLYEEATRENSTQAKYNLAEFISNNPDGVYFNDSVWHGFQSAALSASEDSRLTREERETLIAKERALQDQQEERWRAYLILQEVINAEGKTDLGRKAARLAIRCLDHINTGRFGRKDEIAEAETELIAVLGR